MIPRINFIRRTRKKGYIERLRQRTLVLYGGDIMGLSASLFAAGVLVGLAVSRFI